MPAHPTAAEVAAFAAAVAAMLLDSPTPDRWRADEPTDDRTDEVERRLDEIGWFALADEPDAAAFAGPVGVELGKSLAPVSAVDRLLGSAVAVSADTADWAAQPLLARYAGSGDSVLCCTPDGVFEATVDGPLVPYVDAWAITELRGVATIPVAVPDERWALWIAASTGYLAGVVTRAYENTLEHARNRIAFGEPLTAIDAVQAKLADTRMIAEGLQLAAADTASPDVLRYSGQAAGQALARCHQIVGAIGFTLEYPLQRYSRRAAALASWNEVIVAALTARIGEPDTELIGI